MKPQPLLSVRSLSVEFRRDGVPTVRALDRVSFDIEPGETLGVVGESGSGKSVMALALLGLLDPAARITSGEVVHVGRDHPHADEATWRRLRGKGAAMVFQQPRRALHAVWPIGRQLVDVLRTHHRLSERQARLVAIERLADVGIDRPERRMDAYSHELSGGQCQRVMIALALAGDPALLIADEPTTGLDVTTQARILDLIASLSARRGLATIFITHDLALAAQRCDRVMVMHAGQVAESAPAGALFADPRHPYTRGLVHATPQSAATLADLGVVPGALPDLTRIDLPACRFLDRCSLSTQKCRAVPPLASERVTGHLVSCWGVD